MPRARAAQDDLDSTPRFPYRAPPLGSASRASSGSPMFQNSAVWATQKTANNVNSQASTQKTWELCRHQAATRTIAMPHATTR